MLSGAKSARGRLHASKSSEGVLLPNAGGLLPSFDGWSVGWPPDFPVDSCVRFSSDVPQEGGKWSCEIDHNGWATAILAYIEKPDTNRKYRLTAWAKSIGTSGYVGFFISSNNSSGRLGSGMVVDDSSWREYRMERKFCGESVRMAGDSDLVIGVEPGVSPAALEPPSADRKVLFDRVQLEYAD